eukprot:gene23934-30218_t
MNEFVKVSKLVVDQLHALPPLSDSGPWGIFSASANGNPAGAVISKNLYYTPDNHPGVNEFIKQLLLVYPSIEAHGAASPSEVNSMYSENLFNTWASIQFDLTPEQITTGLLIPDQNVVTPVAYSILVNPVYASLPKYNYTSFVFNSVSCDADAFWATGYMTLENFVSTYLAKLYATTPADFAVETYMQRYPSSPVYESDPPGENLPYTRWSMWKWLAPPVLAIVMFTPMLSLLTENVRERQFKMKD